MPTDAFNAELSLAVRRGDVWSSLLVAGVVVVLLMLIAWQAMKAGDDAVAEWMADR